MKLLFSKDEEENIIVKMAKGTVVEEFSYVEMIKILLQNNTFDNTDFGNNITSEEIERIESMLSSINDSLEVEEENQ